MPRRNIQNQAADLPMQNSKHELFCWLYAGYHNRELFGNGQKSYMQAYGYNDEIIACNNDIEKLRREKPRGYTVRIQMKLDHIKSRQDVARANGSALLATPNVRRRVDWLIDQYINNEYTDRELQYTIMQRWDLNAKVTAIREFNRLKARGQAGKIEGNFTFAWENDDESSTKKKPTIKKIEIKNKENDNVEWQQ